MHALVTGGAGFIGSNLAERLLALGHAVTAIDNLSGGNLAWLEACFRDPRFRFEEMDLLDRTALDSVVGGHDVVFHLAANSNIPEGRRRTDIDLQAGTLATYNTLEAMRCQGVRRIVFASSSVVYGEPSVLPTPENYGPLLPVSLYGASKLACEGLISAFCHNYGIQGWILRFANICGRHATHGVILDFIHKLRSDSARLEILGDGRQAKPYLHVSECVDGILYAFAHAQEPLNFFNLGCDRATSTRVLAHMLVRAIGDSSVQLQFTGGERGWPGDVPQVRLDCTKLQTLGWRARLSSDEAVARAITEIIEQEHLSAAATRSV